MVSAIYSRPSPVCANCLKKQVILEIFIMKYQVSLSDYVCDLVSITKVGSIIQTSIHAALPDQFSFACCLCWQMGDNQRDRRRNNSQLIQIWPTTIKASNSVCYCCVEFSSSGTFPQLRPLLYHSSNPLQSQVLQVQPSVLR